MSRGRRRRRAVEGLTLIEAAVIVCLVGVALAVFIPTFARQLRTSKVSEAGEQLAQLHALSAAYFAERHPATEEGGGGRQCLPETAGPAPADPSVDPVIVDFAAEETPGRATWEALGFAPERPLRYRYSFLPVRATCGLGPNDGATVLVLRAEGDLDGDGDLSRFERRATVDDLGALVPKGVLQIEARVE